MKRKMSKKLKFSVEEEEKIIDFVKNNEILYNAKHKQFRETERKNFLWLQLAKDLKMDGLYSTLMYIHLIHTYLIVSITTMFFFIS